MSKKVLIISYYWPPSGGGGVQRWLKFTKYLPAYDWEPVIFTPENPDFELKDDSLSKDVAKNLEVIRFPIWEPFGVYKKLMGKSKQNKLKQGVVIEKSKLSFVEKIAVWVRGNVFFPDPRRFWVKPSVDFLTDYVERANIDVVITTGPPHSMHLIGLGLKKRKNIKWIADFRDPWSDWDMLDKLQTTSLVKSLHRSFEKKVLNAADLVLTVTPRLADALQSKLKSEKVKVVTNGVDPDDFLIESNPAHATSKFRISHMGLLNEIRNPLNFWSALAELSAEEAGFKDDLEVLLAGMVSESIMSDVKDFGLEANITHLDYISHNDVLSYYHHSSLLLMLLNDTDNAKWILPGKLFEYIYSKKKIIGLGPIESDANDVLKETQSGSMFEFLDKEGIKTFLLEKYRLFKAEELKDNSVHNTLKIERQELSRHLSILLNDIANQ